MGLYGPSVDNAAFGDDVDCLAIGHVEGEPFVGSVHVVLLGYTLDNPADSRVTKPAHDPITPLTQKRFKPVEITGVNFTNNLIFFSSGQAIQRRFAHLVEDVVGRGGSWAAYSQDPKDAVAYYHNGALRALVMPFTISEYTQPDAA